MNPLSKKLLNLGGILVLIVVTVLVTLRFVDGGGDTGKKEPAPRPPKQGSGERQVREPSPEAPPELKAGEKAIVEQVEEEDPIDPGRLKVTYQEGKTYANLVQIDFGSKGSHKDWGINADMNFKFVGEFQFNRYIVSNDGQTLVSDIQVDKAVTLECFAEVESLELDLPPEVCALVDLGLLISGVGIIPGTTEVTSETVNEFLSPIGSELLSPVANDAASQMFLAINELQGKKARVVYRNGKGLESITPIDCSLNGDERGWFEDVSMISDIAIMESLECEPGDQWLVAAQDFIPVIDPSLKAKCSGSVTIRRGRDLGGASNPAAVLEVTKGVIDFRDRYQGAEHQMQEAARWAPKGNLVFDFEKGIVTEAQLGGSIDYTERSLDHLIFEMKHSQRPTYSVTYSAWILDGPAKKPELMAPPEGVMRRLKSLQR